MEKEYYNVIKFEHRHYDWFENDIYGLDLNKPAFKYGKIMKKTYKD